MTPTNLSARESSLWAEPCNPPSSYSSPSMWAEPCHPPSSYSSPSQWEDSDSNGPPSNYHTPTPTQTIPARKNKLPPIITSDTPSTIKSPTILGHHHNGPTLTPPTWSPPLLQLSPIPIIFDFIYTSMLQH